MFGLGFRVLLSGSRFRFSALGPLLFGGLFYYSSERAMLANKKLEQDGALGLGVEDVGVYRVVFEVRTLGVGGQGLRGWGSRAEG